MAFDTRRGLLAKIHIAKKDLGLDDEAYRDVLAAHGVESSKNLDTKGLEKLLAHFEKLGWAESTVVIRFWIVAMMLSFVGLATLKLR